jgi:pimeloyl-ACP methyl ester carboxylesterase
MKTLKTIFMFIAVTGLIVSCSKDNNFFGGDSHVLKNGQENYCKSYHGLDQDRYVTMKATGLKVHYRIIGKGPIDIVFIPGWTNPLTVYTKQFDYFRDKARCIYVDLPGHGLSDAPEGTEYTMGLMADAIYDVIIKEGIKKFVGVGFSMGPIPLGQFEIKHPGMITKLVNLDGLYAPWPTEEPARQTYIDELEWFLHWIGVWSDEEKASLGLIPETAPQDLKDWSNYFFAFPNWLMQNIYFWLSREEVNKPVGWEIPILSIYVTPQDPDLEALMFPNSNVIVIENSGHCVHWEKHEIVNPLIWEFVSDRPGRRY